MIRNEVPPPQAFWSLDSRVLASFLGLTVVCGLLLACPAMARAELRKVSYYSRLHGRTTIHVYTPPGYDTRAFAIPSFITCMRARRQMRGTREMWSASWKMPSGWEKSSP